MFEVLLPDQTRVLGADHRDTLWTNNDYRVINISHIESSHGTMLAAQHHQYRRV